MRRGKEKERGGGGKKKGEDREKETGGGGKKKGDGWDGFWLGRRGGCVGRGRNYTEKIDCGEVLVLPELRRGSGKGFI